MMVMAFPATGSGMASLEARDCRLFSQRWHVLPLLRKVPERVRIDFAPRD